MIDCKIYSKSFPYHLWQVLAGFSMLHQQRIIKLSFVESNELLPHLMFRVSINQTSVIFDLNDGYDDFREAHSDYVDFYNNLLSSCSFLFKRSFSALINSEFKESSKVRPLCLYYKTTLKECR